jgi:hypothetical protein
MAKKRNTRAADATSDAPKVNKSAIVREYLKEHKQARPKEIVAALEEQGSTSHRTCSR